MESVALVVIPKDYYCTQVIVTSTSTESLHIVYGYRSANLVTHHLLTYKSIYL